MAHTLDYLIFDYSEDDEGNATWDAMATLTAEQFAPLIDEVALVLGWAQRHFAQLRGPLDEGFLWDYDLSLRADNGREIPVQVQWSPVALHYTAPTSSAELLTLTLTLSGRNDFAAAFAESFELE